MVRAKLISTEGPYLEAQIEVEGQRLCVMDEFGVHEAGAPAPGQEFDFEFRPTLEDDEEWEAIFNGNPSSKVGLEGIEG